MKKISLILILLIFVCTTASFACWSRHAKTKGTTEMDTSARTELDFEILPTMTTESNAKNTVWVGTFQLIWNDLIDEIIKHPVKFSSSSVMADNLNKREFTADSLLESSFYKKLGLVSKDLKTEIEKSIKDKFGEKSDILDRFDWTPAPEKYILYAMLKKDFQYLQSFDKLEDAEFKGSTGKVKYFGIDEDSKRSLRRTVDVLFYNGSNDYAVSLHSKEGDTVFLYRTDDKKTFDKLYKDMTQKADKYEGKKYLANIDKFKAPNIEFKKEREFKELCNKPIKNSNYMISKALETVQFKMDETGVKLKSEAVMIVAMACAPGFREEPRFFYFNDRYIIFLQEKDKPYFAMKIEDAKALQK